MVSGFYHWWKLHGRYGRTHFRSWQVLKRSFCFLKYTYSIIYMYTCIHMHVYVHQKMCRHAYTDWHILPVVPNSCLHSFINDEAEVRTLQCVPKEAGLLNSNEFQCYLEFHDHGPHQLTRNVPLNAQTVRSFDGLAFQLLAWLYDYQVACSCCCKHQSVVLATLNRPADWKLGGRFFVHLLGLLGFGACSSHGYQHWLSTIVINNGLVIINNGPWPLTIVHRHQ